MTKPTANVHELIRLRQAFLLRPAEPDYGGQGGATGREVRRNSPQSRLRPVYPRDLVYTGGYVGLGHRVHKGRTATLGSIRTPSETGS